jgi:putative DNA primase/helicase
MLSPALVARGRWQWRTCRLAVLFRVTSLRKPSLLCDEYDAWIRTNEELRGLLNSGHRRGGQALRCEGDGNDVRAFLVFAPVLLAGIGHLPGTLRDRSIVVKLDRAKPGELPQRLDSRRLAGGRGYLPEDRPMGPRPHRYSHRFRSRPARWSCSTDRADNWRPLFAIAEVVGGDWPARTAAAQAALSYGRSRAPTLRESPAMLLEDIRANLWAAAEPPGCSPG